MLSYLDFKDLCDQLARYLSLILLIIQNSSTEFKTAVGDVAIRLLIEDILLGDGQNERRGQ